MVKTLSYSEDKKGMCFGILAMAIQAHLAGDLESFVQRLPLLELIPTEKLSAYVDRAKKERKQAHDAVRDIVQKNFAQKYPELTLTKNFEKSLTSIQLKEYYQILSGAELKADASLSSKAQKILNIPVFFEGVSIHHEPKKFSQLFDNEKIFKYIIKTNKAPLATDLELENTIVLFEEDEMVTAYWLAEGVLVNCSFLEASLPHNIRNELSKMQINSISTNETFIAYITEKFKCDKGIISTPIGQNILSTFSKVSPFTLSTIMEVDSFLGLYNHQELVKYLQILKAQLAEFKINEPIAFMLKNYKHGVGICWDPRKQWSLIDANKLHLAGTKFSEDRLAAEIVSGFSDNGIVTFATYVYSKNPSSSPLQECMASLQKNDQWQAIHQVTPKKAEEGDSSDSTQLYIAVQNNQKERVKLLLKAGAKVNKIHKIGISVIFIAVQHNCTTLLKLLLEAGAKVNVSSKYGSTPLFDAAQYGHVESIKLLLEAGAEINIVCVDNLTPFFIAIQKGHTEVVKLLLKAGADIKENPALKITPLYYAAQLGRTDIIKLLLEKKDIDVIAPIEASVNLLKKFAEKEKKSSPLNTLLQAKKIKKATMLGFTALHAAAFFGHTEALQELLKAGADPFKITECNIGPLDFAKAMGYTEIINILNAYLIMPELKVSSNCPLIKRLQRLVKNPNDIYVNAVQNYLDLKLRLARIKSIADQCDALPEYQKFCQHLNKASASWEQEFAEAKDIVTEVVVIKKIDEFIKAKHFSIKKLEEEKGLFFKLFSGKKLSHSFESVAELVGQRKFSL